MSEQDTDRRSDLAVMDANEYKNKRRLEEILDALAAVDDTANEAWDRYAAGEIQWHAKNIAIQRAVSNAIEECYTLLVAYVEDYDGDDGGHQHDPYWHGQENGGLAPIGTIPREQDDDITIHGLKEYLDLPVFLTEAVTKTVNPRNMPPRRETREIEQSVPEQVTRNAFLRLKLFLDREHDLDIQFEELNDELPTYGFIEVDEVDEEQNGDGGSE